MPVEPKKDGDNMTGDGPRVLVVDDEINICRNCVKILSKLDYSVDYTLNGYDALARMEAEAYDVVITDLKMGALGGMEVLSRIKSAWPETMVIVITGYSTVSSAVEVMKIGAFDYLPKPFTPPELRTVVAQAVSQRKALQENRGTEKDGTSKPKVFHQLIGDSSKIQKVVSMIEKVAPTDATVLLHGESGTGKELVARAVHANSNRNREVFFAVDCGTLSAALLESELFGHAKGAFTDAHRDKEGIFSRAQHGTVFLDEISNISLEVQGKLLRFLESREFLPLGATTSVQADVRLIFATNRNLEDMMSRGEFREDFYYRIFVYPIYLPPLRDRRSDILPIAFHFLRQFAQRMNKNTDGFDDRAAQRLRSFDWPGNVRQLRNTIERAIILCEGDRITDKDLALLNDTGDMAALFESVPETNEDLKTLKKEIRQKAVNRIEANFIQNALSKNEFNVTQAARETGMQRTNFQNLMKKHGIKLPSKH
jgi:DNA-binding NtrC family response regulator